MTNTYSHMCWTTLPLSGLPCYWEEELGEAKADKADNTHDIVDKVWVKLLKAKWSVDKYRTKHLPGEVTGLLIWSPFHSSLRDPTDHITVSLVFAGTHTGNNKHVCTVHIYAETPPDEFMPRVPLENVPSPSTAQAYAADEGILELPARKSDWVGDFECNAGGGITGACRRARESVHVEDFRGKRRLFLTSIAFEQVADPGPLLESVELWIYGRCDRGLRRWIVRSLYRRDTGEGVVLSDVKQIGSRQSITRPKQIYVGPGTDGLPMNVVLSVFPQDEIRDNTWPDMENKLTITE